MPNVEVLTGRRMPAGCQPREVSLEQPTSRPERLNGVRLLSARQTVRTLHLPLGRTALCLDCETCFEIGTDRCPVCGSGTWASVARLLQSRLKDERHLGARSVAVANC